MLLPVYFTAHESTSRKESTVKGNNFITKTYQYNFDPLKPYFYIVKLGFT